MKPSVNAYHQTSRFGTRPRNKLTPNQAPSRNGNDASSGTTPGTRAAAAAIRTGIAASGASPTT